jgi:hypothetical protein
MFDHLHGYWDIKCWLVCQHRLHYAMTQVTVNIKLSWSYFQILSQGDIGHDLTTIHLLLSKHKSLETEIRAHENTLRQSMSAGEDLINQGHFGSDRVQQRLDEVNGMWQHLVELMEYR